MWHKVYEYDNLILAFHKAAKGKQRKTEVMAFKTNFHHNIMYLSNQIKSFNVPIGNYQYFEIHDPKQRTISAASFVERVYHHAIMNIYHEAFETAQIDHSYATRPNKGTHMALHQTWINCQTDAYWLKLDVKKFFDSIHHPTLDKLLCAFFEEKEIQWAFYQIIKSYQKEKDRGLPIGNLTSQYFANFYLSFLDRFCINNLGIKKYIRYMDDIVLWIETNKDIWLVYNKINLFLNEQLNQTFKPYTLNKNGFRLPFLGYLVDNNGIMPNKRNRKKYKKKISELTILNNEDKQLNQYWILKQFYEYQVNTHI